MYLELLSSMHHLVCKCLLPVTASESIVDLRVLRENTLTRYTYTYLFAAQ